MYSTRIFVLLFFVSFFSFTSGRTITVPDDYKNIQTALEKTESGDTVFVKNGIYKENIIMPDDVVLAGEDVDNTVIYGNRKNPAVTASNNSLITNFTIKKGGDGILCKNTNMVIRHNKIVDNKKSGILCVISLPQITDNIIEGNGWTGVFCELITSGGMNTSINHNVIAENGKNGVMLSNKSIVLVQNNIFYKNKEFGIYVTKSSRRSRIIYNAFFQNRRSFTQYAIVDETNISKDPGFPAKLVTSFETLINYDSPLRGMGKDGVTIGLIRNSGSASSNTKDSDNDGIPDDKDSCINEMEDMDGFEDDDGCPDFDNDFDGLYDSQDLCPDDPEDFDGFEDENGCPDPDNDQDGILDVNDKCPNEPETMNDYKDEDGCPDNKP